MARAGIAATSGALLLAVVAGCASLAEEFGSPLLPLEEQLVFWPVVYPRGDWKLDPGVEDMWVPSTDGALLNGWYVEATNPRAVVLYMHGNAGNITQLRQSMALFHDKMHASILLFDYRGYGRSVGSPSEAGVMDDARAARGWLARKTGLPEKEIVLVGHSLGGGVAVDLAAKDGARGLILESTFTSLPDAAEHHVPVSPFMQMRFDSLAKIASYHGPLLQVHGDADDVIPLEIGRKLFTAANGPKTFVAIPGGGHNDDAASVEYQEALDRFLASLPAVRRP